MTQNTHPARSPEFLSRLHDGELDPGERAHFESHRAHCVECRDAAIEFEAALALYRSSHAAPAAPDLAARILRKLQSAPARRFSFGPTFGIDLRWAGAFAAALIAAVVGSSIVAKNEAREKAMRTASVPVVLERAPTEEAGPDPHALDGRFAPAPGSPSRKPQPEMRAALQEKTARNRSQRDEKEAPLPASAGAVAAAPAPPDSMRQEVVDGLTADRGAPSELKKEKAANAAPMAKAFAPPAAKMAGAASRADAPASVAATREGDRAGGEGGVVEPSPVVPVRVLVWALDGNSSTPDLIAASVADVPASLRGQQFVVVVDAAGRVRQVTPRQRPQRDANRANEIAAAPVPPASSPLMALRFAPGDRTRRLLVRVE
jgi:hypothetical protein